MRAFSSVTLSSKNVSSSDGALKRMREAEEPLEIDADEVADKRLVLPLFFWFLVLHA
jgi:hypothetical protein